MKLNKVVESEVGVHNAVVAWTIKAYPQPTLPMDIGMAVLAFFSGLFFLYGRFVYEDEHTKHLVVNSGVVGVVIVFILWIAVVRQKTVYSYRFTESGCEVEYWLNFPKSGSLFFKGLAIFALIAILSMISIDPSLIWIAAGPAGISIAAAVKLLNWENPVEHHATDWARYDLVFIDRKRKMVVPSFHADPLAGFEVHLEKARIDDFVAFLKTVIPHAEFREAEWKW
ncbi:hypothetical protein [Pseudomonas sp. Irchel 3A5]|uniref:hypothetical protein n=1 Tax=Pseudomonas sp. Irchel 3A5 TaxID=2008911 RepID=UPI00114021E6|nr:hypothetical protein [Pseudomonas sp. Irchel 3A5]